MDVIIHGASMSLDVAMPNLAEDWIADTPASMQTSAMLEGVVGHL
jgi:hypothetical protein